MSEESRMKKTIIRIAVCVVVFLASALIIGSIMNQGHNNMTMEMAPATLPMITMESGGVACNELHGNTVEMDVAYQKDCITLLGRADRRISPWIRSEEKLRGSRQRFAASTAAG